MPNQRKAGKKQAGVWVEAELYNKLKELSVKQKTPISELVKTFVKDGLGIKKNELKKGMGNDDKA